MSIDIHFRFVRGDFTLDVKSSLPSRGITALFGPSGCGKSTLLRCMAGLEYCREGYIKVGPKIWQDHQYFMPPHQRFLGYVFQEVSLFSHLNVGGNIRYGLKRVPQKERRVSLEKTIDLLGVKSLLKRRIEQLSGGERQRVAIARALAVNPRILLLDEPLAALDEGRKQEIMPYLESLHRELDIPVIYVSHSLDEVVRLADYLVYMEAGQVRAAGFLTDMLTRLDFPMAHRDDAESLVEAVVCGYDDKYALTYLDFPGGRFSVARPDLTIGQPARLRILARDVSITLQRQSHTSILNIHPATVEELMPYGSARMIVRLSVGKISILSLVTRKSADQLALKKGKPVFVQVKSVALLS